MMTSPPGIQKNDLINYIIDIDDEDCPDFSLHLAAYQNDVDQIKQILESAESQDLLEARIRPFLATPLRLAATSGAVEAIDLLLEAGAGVDAADVKAQTPLFVAIVNKKYEAAVRLLEAGADPNGSDRNLCTPLAVAAQRGHVEGVRILCRYGADTEDILRLMSGLPGFPLTVSATYHHLEVFATLLVHGAKPDLESFRDLDLDPELFQKCSVPHTIIRYDYCRESSFCSRVKGWVFHSLIERDISFHAKKCFG